MNKYIILVINPGSTSTKISIYENTRAIVETEIVHTMSELGRFDSVIAQKNYRLGLIELFLIENNFKLSDFDAIVGRGGFIKPIKSGVYEIEPKMVEDLENEKYGMHASNLGIILAYELSKCCNTPAFTVDAIVSDDFTDIARISGLKGIERRSVGHILNQKAVGMEVCKDSHWEYNNSNLIVAHLGGGISIGAHFNGEIIDMVNAVDGEGPFSPTRTGTIPLLGFAEKIIDDELTYDQVKQLIANTGGLKSYMNSFDLREIELEMDAGDESHRLLLEAMAYQIAKGIAEMAVVLHGNVDVIILTGGMSYSKRLTKKIIELTDWISKVKLKPGQKEMQALANGALEALTDKNLIRVY